MLRQAYASFENNIQNNAETPPSEKIRCIDYDHFLQIGFGSREPNSQFAKHTITAEERDGEIAIETWVIANGNFGFSLGDIVVSNANTFVPAILALREKTKKLAVQEAYEAEYRRC